MTIPIQFYLFISFFIFIFLLLQKKNERFDYDNDDDDDDGLFVFVVVGCFIFRKHTIISNGITTNVKLERKNRLFFSSYVLYLSIYLMAGSRIINVVILFYFLYFTILNISSSIYSFLFRDLFLFGSALHTHIIRFFFLLLKQPKTKPRNKMKLRKWHTSIFTKRKKMYSQHTHTHIQNDRLVIRYLFIQSLYFSRFRLFKKKNLWLKNERKKMKNHQLE